MKHASFGEPPSGLARGRKRTPHEKIEIPLRQEDESSVGTGQDDLVAGRREPTMAHPRTAGQVQLGRRRLSESHERPQGRERGGAPVSVG
jgi:hypothetical protein